MKKLCSLAEGLVRFRVNYNIKKELQVRIRKKKKKGKVEQLVTYGTGLDRKLFGSYNMMYNITCSDTDA